MKKAFRERSPVRKDQILVIEDNADSWHLTRWALLRTFPEVEAVWRQTDAETLFYLETCLEMREALPKIILLDLYLPTSSVGWNLLEILKTHHIFRQIPVVILSNSSDKRDIQESYIFRASSYIVKPVGYEDWLTCFGSFQQYWHSVVTLPKAN